MPRIFIWILAFLFGLSLLLGAQYSRKQQINQEKMFTGGAVVANPLGDLIFVDSASGRNGNSGADPRHALATLTYAMTVAQAGDTIVLAPGGSETVTATIAANLARVKIVCPVGNPDSGFTIAGAGTLDLITVSAADVCISGLKFTHTGATSSAAGILTTAAADRLRVESCAFDHSAIVTTFTGFGVEITDDCDYVEVVDCHFRDCHRGIIFVTGAAKNQLGARIESCTFWVGQATAFGIHANPTGTVKGLQVSDCLFRELDGDGGAATDAWDGSDSTDAASGPILFGAAVDQYSASISYAETALSVSFDNLNAINAGADGELIRNKSGSGGDEQDTLNTINTQIGADDATTTDNVMGKLGTDTELADRSVFDLLAGDGPAVYPAAAAAAHDVSLAEVVRYIQESQIGTLVNAGGTATVGGIFGDFANSSLVTRLGNVQTEVDKVGTLVNAGGTATLGGILGDFANSDAVTRFGNIQTEVDKIGTVVNAGGTATVGAILGDFANTTLIAIMGIPDSTTTESVQGKVGTDTEMDDNSLWDYLVPVEATGEADIDISEADYTTYINILTITPAANQCLIECVIDLDYNKTTTGWDIVSTAADTLDVVIVTKVDGTNYRTVMNGTQIAANGDESLEDNESGERFIVGPVGVTGTIQVKVKLSIERDDVEIPYRVLYRGATPTITPVALP